MSESEEYPKCDHGEFLDLYCRGCIPGYKKILGPDYIPNHEALQRRIDEMLATQPEDK